MEGKKLYIGYLSITYPHFVTKTITKETAKTIKTGYGTFRKDDMDKVTRDGNSYGCLRIISLDKGVVIKLMKQEIEEASLKLDYEISKLNKKTKEE